MDTEALIRKLGAAGIRLDLDGESLIVRSATPLSKDLRESLRDHKPDLIEYMRAAHETAELLIAAAMRACDHHGDSEEARTQMVRDCLDTPLELRRDLLDHFDRAYQPARNDGGGSCSK
jgi:hypothetical protein